MEIDSGKQPGPETWRANQNERVAFDHEEAQANGQPEVVIRSARNLESYKRIFGEGFGQHEELILDVGAGDTTAADEIEALTDHKTKVVRFDNDYADVPPVGEAPAVAGDATKMPFADSSFDRVVSHNMMYYLGHDRGAEAVGEMLRVLKDGGEAIVYPAKPFTTVHSALGHKETHSSPNFPNLVITKPEGFDAWDEASKQEAYRELAKAVTGGKVATKLIHWGIARAIQQKGTHRTIERGSSSSL